MVVNMLKAISQMLAVDGATATPAAYERVKCAKIMLDEIIKGMEGKEPQPLIPPMPPLQLGQTPYKSSPLAEELAEKEPEYKLEINPDKTLKLILRDGKPLDPKALLLIDKKQVAYKDALGKPFTNLKVVE